MAGEDPDERYFNAVLNGTNVEMLKASKGTGGFFYKEAFSTERQAMILSLPTHEKVLHNLLLIKQVPDVTKIELAVAKVYNFLSS